MLITNFQDYEGHYENVGGSFVILIDTGDSFEEYFMRPGMPAERTAKWMKKDLDNPAAFPEAVGKFNEELAAMWKPIEIDAIPTYAEARKLINAYLKGYGERMK